MQRKLFLFIILSFLGFSIVAQEANDPAQKPITQSALYTQHLRKYAVAARWNDYEVAKQALYDLILINPSNDSLIYTLAYYYYEKEQFASAMLVSQELLTRNPKSIDYLQLSAASCEAVGVLDKALQNYESLYLLTDDITLLYKICFLQLDLKRFTECSTNVDILLSKPEVDTVKVAFNDAENRPKEYLMRVAVLNLKGLISIELGDKGSAKKYFEEALSTAPDFQPAKLNLIKVK